MNAKKMITAALAAGLLAFLVAARLHAQSGGFRFFGPLSRVMTPNGDNINDKLFICFDNFSDSGVSGKVFTLLGSEVATMGSKLIATGTSCPGGSAPQYISWDGMANGARVNGGLYIYRIESEGKTYSGTFLVVR